jgi:hypothetical protein
MSVASASGLLGLLINQIIGQAYLGQTGKTEKIGR